MNQLIKKYRESLRFSFILGLGCGVASVASLNVLLFAYFMHLNLFIWVSGFIGAGISAALTYYWKNYADDNCENLKKEVAKMFADKNGN